MVFFSNLDLRVNKFFDYGNTWVACASGGAAIWVGITDSFFWSMVAGALFGTLGVLFRLQR